MIKVDLITGFLGSGKTTFIKKYAASLLKSGLRVGVLINDYGAVNVDMMLLQELENMGAELEMVAGACDYDCHKRRFKTKLIAMGMSGFDRVLIEPSGIFDADEFFDSLYEEPLDRWYEIGSVISIADASLDGGLSEQAEYLLASQLSSAGKVVLSKVQNASAAQLESTIAYLNSVMEKFKCNRRFSASDILAKPWDELDSKDIDLLKNCGHISESNIKHSVNNHKGFESLYFMNVNMTANELEKAVKKIFSDRSCGNVFRVKGFVPSHKGWTELNASKDSISFTHAERGQSIIIVIGENLNRDKFPFIQQSES